MERSPHEDIIDIIGELPKEMEEIAFGRRFRLSPDRIFVIGGSFGGTAAILASLDPRVSRVIANCPVVDWEILDRSEKVETRKENYADYIREAFGNGYRRSDANWEKLRSGTFYDPWYHRNEITASKVMIFHAKDILMCLIKEVSNLPNSPESHSSRSSVAGISARTTLFEGIGRRSRSSSILSLS